MSKARATDIFAKIIRVLTLPPVAALLSLVVLSKKGGILTTSEFVVGIICLCAVPILSYAIEPLFRKDKSKRDSQRTLAVVFSLTGYAACNIYAWCVGSSAVLKTFFCTYLISVSAILIFDLLGVKCSGHACGFVGPFVFLGTFAHPLWFLGLLLLGGLFWASLRIKRHTLGELILGSATPVVALGLSCLIFCV